MTILGIPRCDFPPRLTLSLFGTKSLSIVRDSLTNGKIWDTSNPIPPTNNWKTHRERNIAIIAVAEAGFACLAVGNTMETVASMIAALVLFGTYQASRFFAPLEFQDVCGNLTEYAIAYAITSLVMTTTTYLSLFENLKQENIGSKAMDKAINFYSCSPATVAPAPAPVIEEADEWKAPLIPIEHPLIDHSKQ